MLDRRVAFWVVAVATVTLAALWLAILWGAPVDAWLALRLTVTVLVLTGVYLIVYLVYREIADERRHRRDGFLD